MLAALFLKLEIMKLYQRWMAVVMISIILSGVFKYTDYQFWLVVGINGIVWGDLFKR